MCVRKGVTVCSLCQGVKFTPIFVRLILKLEHFLSKTIEFFLEIGSILEMGLYCFKTEIENCKYWPNEKLCELGTFT